MPAAVEMGPHREGAAFYCPCGKIYLKYRALLTHFARNPSCGQKRRERNVRMDAELKELRGQWLKERGSD